ncbi:MAG TPA: GlsB/YeaQ/YmgE family stress response membrane protein [Candidatus Binataceae bacterium]|nr:GlsB/YeaQ/YmgE family stress response membrane protein [Candidatus Binataceae bacterium]
MNDSEGDRIMHYIWLIIIGFVAGVIAKLIHPGSNEPSGFILTTILGIVGAFVATFLGQAVGWYRPGESAGLIGGVIGAVILLVIWSAIARRQGAV